MTLELRGGHLDVWVTAGDNVTVTATFGSIPAGSWQLAISGDTTATATVTPSGNDAPIVFDTDTLGVTAGGTYWWRLRNTTGDRTYLQGRLHVSGTTGGTITDANVTVTVNAAAAVTVSAPVGLTGADGVAQVPTETATSGSTTPAAATGLVLADATAGNVTVNLPPAASNADRVLHVKRIDATANTVTIDGDGAETIDGATTASLAVQYESVTLGCDGTEWWIL